MSEKRGVIRALVMDAVGKKINQTNLAEEVEICSSQITRFLSGEGALKLAVLEKIASMSGSILISQDDHDDTEAMLRGFARRMLKK